MACTRSSTLKAAKNRSFSHVPQGQVVLSSVQHILWNSNTTPTYIQNQKWRMKNKNADVIWSMCIWKMTHDVVCESVPPTIHYLRALTLNQFDATKCLRFQFSVRLLAIANQHTPTTRMCIHAIDLGLDQKLPIGLWLKFTRNEHSTMDEKVIKLWEKPYKMNLCTSRYYDHDD